MTNPDQTSASSDQSRTFTVESGHNKEQALTVSEITSRIQSILEKGIGDVWVKGEISNLSFPRSGHVYFDLKDEDAVLPVALFRREARSVEFDLEDGLEVRLYGRVSAYKKRGNYQIIAERVFPLGEGALQLAFKQLKEKLEKEGLFSPEHKQPLPDIPRRIGVVTSATGAAVRDIIRTIKSRFPPADLLIVPVKVQGEEAADGIAEAIELLNRHQLVDIIITGRGGGSLEDLWAFNEEIVARAIFQSNIPVVSAVGHEVDTTISDLVADHTVPTPTAAGQGVVPEYDNLIEQLQNRFEYLTRRVRQLLSSEQDRFEATWKRVSRSHPEAKLERNHDELVQKMRSIHREMSHKISSAQDRLSAVAEQLDHLNPLNVLGRGYSITRDAETDDIIRSSSDLSEGDTIRTTLSDGSFNATVKEVQEEPSDKDPPSS
jgi:exodeoxyribonuclease VII large subunit